MAKENLANKIETPDDFIGKKLKEWNENKKLKLNIRCFLNESYGKLNKIFSIYPPPQQQNSENSSWHRVAKH